MPTLLFNARGIKLPKNNAAAIGQNDKANNIPKRNARTQNRPRNTKTKHRINQTKTFTDCLNRLLICCVQNKHNLFKKIKAVFCPHRIKKYHQENTQQEHT